MSLASSTFERWQLLGALALISLFTAHNASAQTAPPANASLSPSATVAPSPIALDAWLTSPSLWQTTADHFAEAKALGFRWVSNAHDAARASSRALRIGNLPVAEVIV